MVTSTVSPYAAMGNNPVSMIDPLGLSPGNPNRLEAITPHLFRPTSPYESVMLSNSENSDKASEGFLQAFFQRMDEDAAAARKDAVATSNSSTTQGDASAPNSSSTSQVVNNDPSSSADAGAVCGSNGGDDPGDGDSKKPLYKVENSPLYNYSNDDDPLHTTYNGMRMNIWYYGNVSKYKRTNWIQTVSTTGYNNDQPFSDVNGDSDPPFYYSWGYLKFGSFGSDDGRNTHFEDVPKRSSDQSNYYFSAEVSLVGERNGKFENIITFKWGYLMPARGVVIMYPVTVTTPSQYQQTIINKAK